MIDIRVQDCLFANAIQVLSMQLLDSIHPYHDITPIRDVHDMVFPENICQFN